MRFVLVFALTLAVAASIRQVLAADLPGVDLPPGESVVDFAWSNDHSLVILTQLQDSYAVRRLELSSGDVSVIAVPKDFGYFKPASSNRNAPQFTLSPRGNALAVVEPARGALEKSRISAYTITRDAMSAVNCRKIPGDFWPEQVAWDSAGERLFIVARRYLFPDQIYSIGALYIESGEFQGVVLKDNVDLISEVTGVSGRNALVVRCEGYQGQYPQEPLIALIDLEHRTSHILHSRSAELGFHALSNGSVLLFTMPGEKGKSAGSDFWLLEPGAVTLRRAQLAFADSAASLQASADGVWLGFLAPESELQGQPGGKGELLALQRIKDGKTVVAATASSNFCFSPSGKRVCALAANSARLYFYELPE